MLLLCFILLCLLGKTRIAGKKMPVPGIAFQQIQTPAKVLSITKYHLFPFSEP